jgi:hypothetical protein
MQKTLFAIALSMVIAAGCGGGGGTARSVQKGMTLYDRADYRGALNELSAVHGAEGSLNSRALARYYVYRGLTEYHLDRRSEALSDLSRGKDVISRGSASWLRSEISAEMDQALAELNAKPAEPTTPTAPPTASATPAAPPATTGDALVPIKTATPAKTATAAAAPVKTAAPAVAPIKTAAPAVAPVKTSAPPTKKLSSSQSTSPK